MLASEATGNQYFRTITMDTTVDLCAPARIQNNSQLFASCERHSRTGVKYSQGQRWVRYQILGLYTSREGFIHIFSKAEKLG